MERFLKINFTIKEAIISNIFALRATNNIAVEWYIAEADREGKEFHDSGVTIIRIKGGKAVVIRECIRRYWIYIGEDYLRRSDVSRLIIFI
jgi:hypothetical protein